MDIERLKTLIAKREEIDREIVSLVSGGAATTTRKAVACSICQGEGHTARTCPQKLANGNAEA